MKQSMDLLDDIHTFLMISSYSTVVLCITFYFSIYGPLGSDAAEYVENILLVHTNVESLRYTGSQYYKVLIRRCNCMCVRKCN